MDAAAQQKGADSGRLRRFIRPKRHGVRALRPCVGQVDESRRRNESADLGFCGSLRWAPRFCGLTAASSPPERTPAALLTRRFTREAGRPARIFLTISASLTVR